MDTPPPSGGLPQAGDVIDNKYRIEREIGRGGMGVVYEAFHLSLGRSVAIKLLQDAARRDPWVVERFETEARAAAAIRGQHVAQVYDVSATAAGLPFMVMEFLDGRDLGDELDHRRTLPVHEAVDYVVDACLAMAEAHSRSIVHRDLKPSNMFLCVDAGRRIVKVVDFGISKMPRPDGSNQTKTGESFGTPSYMSPEQIEAAKDVDGRADIWALGAILYELLVGRPLFNGVSRDATIASIVKPGTIGLDALPAGVPAGLKAALARALERDRELRFARVDDFAAAIRPFAKRNAPSPNATEAAGPVWLGARLSSGDATAAPSNRDHDGEPQLDRRQASLQETEVFEAPRVSATEPFAPARRRSSMPLPVVASVAAAIVVVALGIRWGTSARSDSAAAPPAASVPLGPDATSPANLPVVVVSNPVPDAAKVALPPAEPPSAMTSSRAKSSGAAPGTPAEQKAGGAKPSSSAPALSRPPRNVPPRL